MRAPRPSTPRAPARTPRLLVVTLLVAALAPACRVRHEAAVTIHPDGSSDLAFVIALDRETQQALDTGPDGGGPGALGEIERALAPAAGEPLVRVEPWSEDGLDGFSASIALPNTAELAAAFPPPPSGASDPRFDETSILVEPVDPTATAGRGPGALTDVWLDLPALAEAATADLLRDGPPLDAQDLGRPEVAAAAEIRVSLEFPGSTVVEHDADTVGGDGRLVWTLFPAPSRIGHARVDLGAAPAGGAGTFDPAGHAEPPASGGSGVPVRAGLLLALGAGLALLFRGARRRSARLGTRR